MTSAPPHTHLFCVAPMMDGTDRHCRYFHRLLTKRARLYTEMITAEALRFGDRERLLGFDAAEHPVALQIGGSDPALLAEAARMGEQYGYDEVNLNVGCPSDRVQSGAFGACLMKTPALVADCVAAMRAAVRIPVTVKCRLGVDDQDPEESLFTFVETVARAGCRTFIVHARKAWLKGLSPKENRDIPPLDYGLVRKLRLARADLTIILNGGIASLDQALELLPDFDGVMLGRAPYADPYLLAEVDRRLFGDAKPPPSREYVTDAMEDYVARMARANVKPHHVTRHMLGLYHGRPGARAYRRILSARGASTTPEELRQAARAVRREPELADT
jgi:tRNA-dihydrouridine synthase A